MEVINLGCEIAAAATPSRCDSCHRPYMVACDIATLIIDGDLPAVDGQLTLRDDINNNCPAGIKRLEGGDFDGGYECQYQTSQSEIIN